MRIANKNAQSQFVIGLVIGETEKSLRLELSNIVKYHTTFLPNNIISDPNFGEIV